MNRRVVVSAIREREIAALWSRQSGYLTSPLSPFSSNFGSYRPKVRTIDFGSVEELDDALHLFHRIVRMRPQPPVSAYNKLLSLTLKMKQYSFALHVFDEMRLMIAPVDSYRISIAINCYCLHKLVKFGFVVVGILFKTGYEPIAAFISFVELFKKLVDLGLCEPNDVLVLTVIDGLIVHYLMG